MSDILTRYRNVEYDLPKTYLSWDLFGAGLENLGRDGKPVELPLREPNDDEVLLRVDAIGLCFSDTKLIWAGPEHPRIRGRDLENDPTVPGHEAALTVVKVGADWADKFKVGERYIIQADITINGEQKAFGYVQRGAMAQYTYVGPWVLNGDHGCYLLPIQDKTGYAEAALVEPWACVDAAYEISARTAPLAGGHMLVACPGDAGAVDVAGLCEAGQLPASVTVIGNVQGDLSALTGGKEPKKAECCGGCGLGKLVEECTGGKGFDDIILIGDASRECIEACDKALGQDGILAFVGGMGADAGAQIDIGRVHYHYTRHIGTTTMSVADAYQANARKEIKAGGACWMIGAAGPMGQMHVQRALELPNPPKKLFATDISEERLSYMENRLANLAKERGVELVCLDISKVDDLDQRLRDFTGGAGFDDIVVMAPVAKLVEHAANFVGDGCVFNIFAGVPLGTMAELPLSMFFQKHTRVIGSSGSSMDDIGNVLRKMEGGTLSTRMSLAALGGIEACWNGIKGVKEGWFPGKTVIFPHFHNLDLTAPEGLTESCKDAVDALEAGNVWTTEAENAILAKLLDI